MATLSEMLSLLVLAGAQTTLTIYKQTAATLGKRYQERNQAIKEMSQGKFTAWLKDNTTSDFIFRSGSLAQSNLPQTLLLMRNELSVLKAVKSSRFELGNVSVHRDHVSCSVKQHLDATAFDGRHIVEDTLTVDTWKPVNSHLKLNLESTTKDRLVINGKVVRSMGG